MKRLKVFDEIAFEVEHELYLARIIQVDSGRKKKVPLNEFEVRSVPIFTVMVHYIPKFARATLDGKPLVDIPKDLQAYRALYETSVRVGDCVTYDEREKITQVAQALAEANPDPVSWKGGDELLI